MSTPTAAELPDIEPQTAEIVLSVNGEARRLELDVRTTLLDGLREHLHLTGTKKGYDHGQCGAWMSSPARASRLICRRVHGPVAGDSSGRCCSRPSDRHTAHERS